MGCDTVPDVIAWADSKIAAVDEPEYAFIELSLLEPDDVPGALSLLSSLSQGADRFAAIREVLGRVYELLCHDRSLARSFARRVYELVLEFERGPISLPGDLSFLYGVDDAFDRDAGGTDGDADDLEYATRVLLNRLRPFASLDNEVAGT